MHWSYVFVALTHRYHLIICTMGIICVRKWTCQQQRNQWVADLPASLPHCVMAVMWFIWSVIWIMWSIVAKESALWFADGLAIIWCQDIFNHHDDIGLLAIHRSAPVWFQKNYSEEEKISHIIMHKFYLFFSRPFQVCAVGTPWTCMGCL